MPFDLVIAINTVHNLPLDGCRRALAELGRVSRAHAFLTERSIDDVSRDVVDRRLRLDGGSPGGPGDGTVTAANG